MRLEWALVVLLGVICVGLSALQYRWTGEFSRAERVRMRGGLENSMRRMVRSFDGEIRADCQLLLPTAAEIRSLGLAEAHRRRYLEWDSSRHQNTLFSRIAVAIREQGDSRLQLIDSAGQLKSSAWPAGWEVPQEAIGRQFNRASALQLTPSGSILVELPVFDDRERNERRQLEWMILELDRDGVRKQLMPRLVRDYLNSESEPQFDVSVTSGSGQGDVVFSTRADGAPVTSGADLTMGLFSGTYSGEPRRKRPEWERGGERRPNWERPGTTERSSGDSASAQWELAVRHRAGSLEAAVNSMRIRNLTVSFALLGALALTAALIVRSTARARRLSEMQFRFAAGVSHDLRTPLTAIRGASFNLVNGMVRDPAALDRYARVILRNSEELTAMVDNVMAYTTTLSGSKPTGGRVDLTALLEQAASTMQAEVQQAGCRLDLHLAPNIPPVTGDPMTLERAFRNLIGNAVRYASGGGWIGVTSQVRDGGVTVRVSDRGPGIPKDEQARIFDPFFRGKQATFSQVHGAGLGLNLVRNAVECHGGTIAVRSDGQGTEFEIWLPAVVSEV